MLKRALPGLWLGLSGAAWGANLDVSASYRLRALSYKNLDLGTGGGAGNHHSFISHDGRLGVAVRKVYLETRGGDDVAMDVGLLLHAVGVAGSTASAQAPFDRAAAIYPNTDFTPFLENAYLRVNNFMGWPMSVTFGRQNFKLGSGLVLDDDGSGLTGVCAKGELPWWGMRLEGFIFNDRNPRYGSPNSLDLFGLSLDLPTEGNWQLHQLFERDRAVQPVYGCSYQHFNAGPQTECQVSKALRSFTGLRYTLSYGTLLVDAEAVLEKGAATPTGAAPSPNHITYNGNAQVVKAKWKQRLYKTGEGIMRMSVARGSGDNPSTKTTDEAFFPSRGHRFSGLERSGFGDFFGATPYDAFGGNYSTTTASGLRQGASGIVIVGAGYTPPAYRGIALDIDYYLFMADRVQTGKRTLGTEWDLKLRYNVQDSFAMSAGVAVFKAGTASNPALGTSTRWTFEASGRF